MNKLKVFTFTALLSTLALTQQNRAAALNLSPDAQATELVELFTGFFDNAQQVATNPRVPLMTISSCPVQLSGATNSNGTRYVYLEQRSSAFERIRFYSFSPGDSTVNNSIRNFVNPNILSGLCNQSDAARIVDVNNIIPTSCDLKFTLVSTRRYFGDNVLPNGCPTSSGGKVLSTLTIFDGGIDSLDQIFDSQGRIVANTPIQFRRPIPIPEPSLNLGILAFVVGLGLKRCIEDTLAARNSIKNEHTP